MGTLTDRKQQAKTLLRNNPVAIGRMVGFRDLTELHNEWLLDWLYSREDSTTLAHRGSFKTTDLALFFALNVLVHPKENTIFLRKTDSDVAEVIRLIARILRSGAAQELARILYGTEVAVLKETTSEIETNLHSGITGASQILGIGIGGSLTGKHADIVVTDDIVNLKDRTSRAERERTKLVYQELQNIKKRGGRIINTGTTWHKEDAISLMPNVKKYDCYTTGLMTEEQIKRLRADMSPSLFAANYELKHIADADAMFDEPEYTSDISKVFDGICHIDAAYGGSDSTALTILAEKDGRLYAYGKKYTKHVDDCIEEILHIKERLRAGTTYTEFNADKGYLNKSLKARGDIAKTYHETTNKHIKIATYLKENWRRITFLDDTDPEYISEILDYTEHAPHDDCPDSLASAIRQLTARKPAMINRIQGGL